jgi:methionyl-tRNA formyltransferase
VTRPLRIVVMGTGPFAVPMFRAVAAGPHVVVAVVTRPDHAAPGRRPPRNPLREAAAAAGLPILDPERVNDPGAVAAIAATAPDLLVVCDYGQILAPELLAVAPLGGINLHGSLLPRHRGAAPVQWTIREGDPLGGVSVIHMTASLDAGNVILARSTAVGHRETAAELEPRLAELGAEAVPEAIERLRAAATGGGGFTVGEPQDAARATRAPRLAKADGIVDWTEPAARIERLRRALEPWPRAATFFTRGDGTRQRLVLEDLVVEPTTALQAVPGTVVEAADDRLVVACGDGTAVRILRLVPEGRRSMSSGEFLRGSPLVPGARLG